MAEGIIYDMFDEKIHKVETLNRIYSEYYVSCDYGTQNATTFILWGKCKGEWYAVKEYYYSGREEARQKTDNKYYEDLEEFLGDIIPNAIIIDPSAASFIALIREKGKYKVRKANNDVEDGIRKVSRALNETLIYFNDCCVNCFREFFSYIWDEKAANKGEDKPIKDNDHCLDAVRYFVNTILFKSDVKPYKEEVVNKGKGVIKSSKNKYKGTKGGVF